MYTTMGTLSGEHTRKHAHDAAGECQLHDDKIEVEVHQTKLLCVKDGGRMHVIAEEEGDGEEEEEAIPQGQTGGGKVILLGCCLFVR